MAYRYLLDIALILLTTKLFGMLTRRFNMPQVVGALVAGLLFGPAGFNILQGTEFITMLSELGVIVIMFTAGMGTDLGELKKVGASGFWVALLGVVTPLFMGMGLGFFYTSGEDALLQNIFIGVVLTATSVSITVEALKEMGQLTTKVGNTILAAALIDDILGLLCLTMISGLGGDESVRIGVVAVKILLFFVFIVVAGFVAHKFLCWYENRLGNVQLQRFPIMAFVLCLLMAYAAEEFFGVADILGAFAAGLVVGNTREASYIQSRFRPLSYLLLAPVFFASIGINVVAPELNTQTIVLTALLILVAIVSKLIGCGLGARLTGMTMTESVQVGFGMICRGEVALIVANKGISSNLMPEFMFGPIIMMVVLITVITPVLLKLVFREHHTGKQLENRLAEQMEYGEQLDAVDRQLLSADKKARKQSAKRDNPAK